MPERNICKDILYGVAIGDALGVPFEFRNRQVISQNPVTDMAGFGTYNLPPGTFSGDSSLTFCLAEALTQEFSLQKIGDHFISWLSNNYWTASGSVFDVGVSTSQAIKRMQGGCNPELAGGMEVADNGNGSLIRILPLLVYVKDKNISERFQITKQVSSITHAHIQSIVACFYYLEFARQILHGTEKFQIYKNLQREIPQYLDTLEINPKEIELFSRLFDGNIYDSQVDEILSNGYVLHTLEASIWCLLTTESYKAATLQAVNLGEDTDTTAAVTGGLAGLLYGYEAIPETWIRKLARKADIESLANRLQGFAIGSTNRF